MFPDFAAASSHVPQQRTAGLIGLVLEVGSLRLETAAFPIPSTAPDGEQNLPEQLFTGPPLTMGAGESLHLYPERENIWFLFSNWRKRSEAGSDVDSLA